MSVHVTKIVRHDVAACNTARHAEGGDCGTRFTVHCSCGFGQGAICREQADAIAGGHPADPGGPVIHWDPLPLTVDTTSDVDLCALFARHCECRPIDLHRREDDHAAIHDCDTAILYDVQIALGIVRYDDIGRVQAMREARVRCAEIINGARLRSRAPSAHRQEHRTMTIDQIVQKIYEERYQDPKDPELGTYMRDGMIREVVQRALALTIGGLATDLVAARRDLNATYERVASWLRDAAERGELVPGADQAPDWDHYQRAEVAWNNVVGKLDAWIAGKEQT